MVGLFLQKGPVDQDTEFLHWLAALRKRYQGSTIIEAIDHDEWAHYEQMRLDSVLYDDMLMPKGHGPVTKGHRERGIR